MFNFYLTINTPFGGLRYKTRIKKYFTKYFSIEVNESSALIGCGLMLMSTLGQMVIEFLGFSLIITIGKFKS